MIELDKSLLPEPLTEERRRELAGVQARRRERVANQIRETGEAGDFERWFQMFRDFSGRDLLKNRERSELKVCLTGLEMFLGKEWREVYTIWSDEQKATKSV